MVKRTRSHISLLVAIISGLLFSTSSLAQTYPQKKVEVRATVISKFKAESQKGIKFDALKVIPNDSLVLNTNDQLGELWLSYPPNKSITVSALPGRLTDPSGDHSMIISPKIFPVKVTGEPNNIGFSDTDASRATRLFVGGSVYLDSDTKVIGTRYSTSYRNGKPVTIVFTKVSI